MENKNTDANRENDPSIQLGGISQQMPTEPGWSTMRSPRPRRVQNFKDAIIRHKREWVIFNFWMSCQYGYANHAYFVLRQDYELWISLEGCQALDLVIMSGLFTRHGLREGKLA